MFQCLTDKEIATFETHKVAPHYFQDKFIFVEQNKTMLNKNEMNASGDHSEQIPGESQMLQGDEKKLLQKSNKLQKEHDFNDTLVYNQEDKAFRNQILIPRYQRKKEEKNNKVERAKKEKIRAKRKLLQAEKRTSEELEATSEKNATVGGA